MSLDITRRPSRDARLAALTGIIDYAGLFPPESLDMVGAVDGYRRALGSDEAWLVDRFICPASRLLELAALLVPTMSRGDASWRVVATGDASGHAGKDVADEWLVGLDTDLREIRTFDDGLRGGASVEVVEKRVSTNPDAAELVEAVRRINRLAYFEVPWDGPDPAAVLEMLAVARHDTARSLGAKIRTGGVTADAFPPPDAVAEFLIACHRLELPVKATAGLHHPIRHVADDTGFTHHGFVNLLVAAALVVGGQDAAVVTAALADDDPSAFTFDRSGIGWRDQHLSAAVLAQARAGLLVAYGSCSVAEPVDDLTALGVLPVPA